MRNPRNTGDQRLLPNNRTVSGSRRLGLLPCIAVVGALLAGCGGTSTSSSASSPASASSGTTSSSGSTPSYCAAVNNFKSAVQGLGNLKVQNGVSELIPVLNNLQTTAKAAVVAVKSTFATQSAAVNRSLASLEMAASQLTNSQTRAAAIVQIPLEIKAAQTTFNGLLNAAKPACG